MPGHGGNRTYDLWNTSPIHLSTLHQHSKYHYQIRKKEISGVQVDLQLLIIAGLAGNILRRVRGLDPKPLACENIYSPPPLGPHPGPDAQ